MSNSRFLLTSAAEAVDEQGQPLDSTVVELVDGPLETSDAPTTAQPAPHPVLRVTVTGGGPVGLSLALLLDHLLGPRVAIKVYDSRWLHDGARVVWKTAA